MPFKPSDSVAYAKTILKPDKRFFALAAIYSVGIGLLTLAVPLAVQALLNTVINTALVPFIVLLAVLLFAVLVISAILIACRDYTMELFERRFLARISADIALRLTHASQPHMDRINRAELVNRFFEIMHVQKNVPALFAEGFFIALQATVGLIVVSFYHPFLLAYNLVFSASVYLIWKLWAKRAVQKAITLSDSKYALVGWLEEIARLSQIFKSEQTINYALQRTERQTETYLGAKRSYFRTTFAQNIAFLLLYCLASAGLLGLGGVLVASNQLSLGQLIGAELILSAIFYSTTKLGYYAGYYYDLRANLDKLSYFFRVPEDKYGGSLRLEDAAPSVTFDQVVTQYRGSYFSFDCHLDACCKALIKADDPASSKLFLDLIIGYSEPERGVVKIGDASVTDFDLHDLRNHILSVDSIALPEGPLQSVFDLMNPRATETQIREALRLVELDEVINQLPDRLESRVVPSGHPLLQSEIIRAKLAAVLTARPRVLVITEIFDIVPRAIRERILQSLCAIPGLMLICFSNRGEWPFFDRNFSFNEGSMRTFMDPNYADRGHSRLPEGNG